MSLAIAILACAGGLGFLVYRYDMYEREPWYMLLLAVAGGGLSFWFLSYAEDYVLDVLTDGRFTTFAVAAVAGVMEEFFKLLIVVVIWAAIPSQFNDPFDGLIYGAMAGLGFALGESVFYVDLIGHRLTWWETIGHESVRLLLHLLMGALTCVGLGFARFRVPGWTLYLAGGVAVSMSLHFAWDYYCGFPPQGDSEAIKQRVAAVVLMLTALALFGLVVMVAAKHSGQRHARNRLRDLWGWPFAQLIRRRKN